LNSIGDESPMYIEISATIISRISNLSMQTQGRRKRPSEW